MEIKTLAQILAESESDSAKSLVDKKSPSDSKSLVKKPLATQPLATKNSPNKTSLKSASSRPTACKNLSSYDPTSTKSAFANEDRGALRKTTDFKKPSRAKKDRSPNDEDYTPPSSLDHHDPYLGSQIDDEASLSGAGKRKPRANRKNRFHPAANYQPTDLNGNLLTDPSSPDQAVDESSAHSPHLPTSDALTTVDEPTIQSILAELKQPAKTHSSTGENLPLNASLASTATRNIEADDGLANADNVTDRDIDNLPSALKVYLLTPEQRHARQEAIKAESRLRWLAFYYLSRREHGRDELKQKLLDKDQDPQKIDALLDEFAEKGYQSDWRTALMLIREGMRKGRGRERIKQDFYKRKLTMPSNIDELIDMASTESDEFADFIDPDAPEEGVDWLKLAVEARVKKYGAALPESQKEKARQLRFLQYRGFKSSICFEALKYDLDTLEDRDY